MAVRHSSGRSGSDRPLIELVDPDAANEDTSHIQYYIATEYGGWALWISCAKGQETEVEATLATLVPLLM